MATDTNKGNSIVAPLAVFASMLVFLVLTACSVILPPHTDAFLLYKTYNGFTVGSQHAYICTPEGIREVDPALENAGKPEGAEPFYSDAYCFYAEQAGDGLRMTGAADFQSSDPPDSAEMKISSDALDRYLETHANTGRRFPEEEFCFRVKRVGKSTYKIISVEPKDESAEETQYAYHGEDFLGETDVRYGAAFGSWAIPGR